MDTVIRVNTALTMRIDLTRVRMMRVVNVSDDAVRPFRLQFMQNDALQPIEFFKYASYPTVELANVIVAIKNCKDGLETMMVDAHTVVRFDALKITDVSVIITEGDQHSVTFTDDIGRHTFRSTELAKVEAAAARLRANLISVPGAPTFHLDIGAARTCKLRSNVLEVYGPDRKTLLHTATYEPEVGKRVHEEVSKRMEEDVKRQRTQ